jgi:hypothetical protein
MSAVIKPQVTDSAAQEAMPQHGLAVTSRYTKQCYHFIGLLAASIDLIRDLHSRHKQLRFLAIHE